MPATEVVHRLTATAIDKGDPGRDDLYGYGIVNLVGALTADVPPSASPRSSTPKPDHGARIALIGFAVALLAAAGLVVALVRLRTATRARHR
jgi:hypothetical protein